MSSMASHDDIALVRLVASADSAALSELYDRYNRLVFSIALAVTGDRATAEEITVDVFVRVWQRAASYQPDRARVSTWLITIARNHAIDVLRRQGTRAEARTIPWDLAGTRPAQPERQLEDHLEVSLRRERIREAIGQLPAEQQEALALAFFGGQSHQEIATQLNQPLGTVKTRIRLGMHKLREILADDHASE